MYFSLKEVLVCFYCFPPGLNTGLQFKMFKLCIVLSFNFPCEQVVTGDDIHLVIVLNREEIQFSLHFYGLLWHGSYLQYVFLRLQD